MTRFAALDAELDRWAANGETASFWWRDDDAGRDSPMLVRLLALAARRRAPLALAVIPLRLDAAAAQRILACNEASVLQHGISHENRARAGEKKCELAEDVPIETTLHALKEAGTRLRDAFGDRALPVLVPPWNRIAPSLVPLLPSIGLSGLSTYRARQAGEAAPGLRQVNTHADLVDWPGTRGFIGDAAALRLLTDHLAARREGRADAAEPSGLLSHHAAHDEACWAFLDALLDHLSAHPAARLLPAEACFA
ncbi:MAG: hypothetical protein AB7P52_18490 [Alphaproteobacteria bacterium]